MSLYETAKTWLVDGSGITKDAWHLYLALAIQFSCAQMFRRRLASLGPVVILIALEALNEWIDYRHYRAVGPDPWAGWAGDTAIDVFNTLFLPLVLMLVARYGTGSLIEQPRAPSGDIPAE